MRNFLISFALIVIVVVAVAGFRGGISRRAPIELFPDMSRQPKLRPQAFNELLSTNRTVQVTGTVASGQGFLLPRSSRGNEAQIQKSGVRGQESAKGSQSLLTSAATFKDSPVYSGRAMGTTNFLLVNPLPVTMVRLSRGHERFQIHCTPCHGAIGDGNGIGKRIGAMPVVANLHDRRIIAIPDGEMFHILTNGKNLMSGYASAISAEDRWAIVAYVRALQLSRRAWIEEVPAEVLPQLHKALQTESNSSLDRSSRGNEAPIQRSGVRGQELAQESQSLLTSAATRSKTEAGE